MQATKKSEAEAVVEGSGNVFRDLGLPESGQELVKARLTFEITRLIKERGLTQTEAAKILGVRQPHVSALVNNRPASFSVGRLVEFLLALGQNIEVTLTPTKKERGDVSVSIAL